MDIATIIGIVLAFGLVLASIFIGGGIGPFIDVPSLLIVVGGTVGVTLINYPLASFLSTFKVVKTAFMFSLPGPNEIIKKMVEMAGKARKEGILALESEADSLGDPFFAKGLRLAVDGQELESIDAILTTEIDYVRDRHKLGAEIFATMGAFAPAMGLVGTLIGLVQMLQSLEDPSAIGPAMAVALLTTFYGSILANMVFLPVSGKLKTRSSEELLIKELQREGILSISAGNNPRVVEEKLLAFLSPGNRESSFN